METGLVTDHSVIVKIGIVIRPGRYNNLGHFREGLTWKKNF